MHCWMIAVMNSTTILMIDDGLNHICCGLIRVMRRTYFKASSCTSLWWMCLGNRIGNEGVHALSDALMDVPTLELINLGCMYCFCVCVWLIVTERSDVLAESIVIVTNTYCWWWTYEVVLCVICNPNKADVICLHSKLYWWWWRSCIVMRTEECSEPDINRFVLYDLKLCLAVRWPTLFFEGLIPLWNSPPMSFGVIRSEWIVWWSIIELTHFDSVNNIGGEGKALIVASLKGTAKV